MHTTCDLTPLESAIKVTAANDPAMLESDGRRGRKGMMHGDERPPSDAKLRYLFFYSPHPVRRIAGNTSMRAGL